VPKLTKKFTRQKQFAEKRLIKKQLIHRPQTALTTHKAIGRFVEQTKRADQGRLVHTGAVGRGKLSFALAREMTNRSASHVTVDPARDQNLTLAEVVADWERNGIALPPLTTPKQIAETLGGTAALGQKVETEQDLIAITRAGLPFKAVEHLQEKLQLTLKEVSEATTVPVRTLSRRRKTAARLSSQESNGVVRLARVFAESVTLLGFEDRAAEWLKHPNIALGGVPPIGHLDTDTGVEQVEKLIGALEHGVYV
jgi:putative toxin-antitoxin system antitoxin component (TIGR02293 family)